MKLQIFNLFKLKYEAPKKTVLFLEILGFLLLLATWQIAANFLGDSILPSPGKVVAAFKEILMPIFEKAKLKDGEPVPQHLQHLFYTDLWYSIKINFISYIKAGFYALVVGFVLGMLPIMKYMTSKQIDALRFLPLTALLGCFIAWFGIDTPMRVAFLTFGIFIYLLPIVVQRVVDVEDNYLHTAHTMGATYWQKFIHVYVPSVTSRVFDDFRVLVAMSWTYVIVAEMVNQDQGIGSLIYMAGRRSRIDLVFAYLLIIILWGFVQDRLFKMADRKIYKHKYA